MPNQLDISCNGAPIGCVANPTRELLRFSTGLAVPPGHAGTMVVQYLVKETFRPARAGVNGDTRELGFAFFGIEVL